MEAFYDTRALSGAAPQELLTAQKAAAVEASPVTLHLFRVVHGPPTGPALVATSPHGHSEGTKHSWECAHTPQTPEQLPAGYGSPAASHRFGFFTNCSNHTWKGRLSPKSPLWLQLFHLHTRACRAQAVSCRTKEPHSERHRSPGTTQPMPAASRELRKECASGKANTGVPHPHLNDGLWKLRWRIHTWGEVFITRWTHGNTTGFLTYTIHKLWHFGGRKEEPVSRLSAGVVHDDGIHSRVRPPRCNHDTHPSGWLWFRFPCVTKPQVPSPAGTCSPLFDRPVSPHRRRDPAPSPAKGTVCPVPLSGHLGGRGRSLNPAVLLGCGANPF